MASQSRPGELTHSLLAFATDKFVCMRGTVARARSYDKVRMSSLIYRILIEPASRVRFVEFGCRLIFCVSRGD